MLQHLATSDPDIR